MKKAFTVIFLVCLLAAYGWAEEAANPSAGFSLILTDSIAFAGFGAEAFLGNVGLGASCTTMFLSANGGTLLFLEPGGYLRYYFAGPQGSFYLGVGATYFTFFTMGNGSASGYDAGLLNMNGAIGFSAMFGNKKEFRFAIELGPRYVLPTAAGSTGTGWVFPHFLLQFGMNI
jgi:outer membrane protein W